jgi:hypothetical protein
MALPSLDAIATIFIFLIGLPAILLQTLPPEVRHTVLKDRLQVAMFTIGPIAVAVLVVGLGIYLTHARGPFGPMSEQRVELAWFVIITALLFVCGGGALLLTERWRRTTVVARLRRAAGRGIALNGRPHEKHLNTLVGLGVQSRGGEDKNLVIVALEVLVAETQARAHYDGAQLEELIKGLEDVLSSGPYSASAANYKAGAELLERLVRESRARPESDDFKMALQLAAILGREALRYEQPHDQIKFVEILALAGEGSAATGDLERQLGYATWASQALLEFGSEAVESGRTLVAMAALSKLENLVFTYGPVRGEMAYDFIGLIAHFHAQRETGRDYGKQFLDPSLFAEPLPEVIRKARTACIQSARFRTGDCLTRLLAYMEAEALAEGRTA